MKKLIERLSPEHLQSLIEWIEEYPNMGMDVYNFLDSRYYVREIPFGLIVDLHSALKYPTITDFVYDIYNVFPSEGITSSADIEAQSSKV